MKKESYGVVVVFAAMACACAAPPRYDHAAWHKTALEATAPKVVGSPAPGSAAESAAVERFRGFFGVLSENAVKAHIREVYAPKLKFNDTLKTFENVDDLEHYLVDTARSVESCTVAIEEVVPAPSGGVYVRWLMNIRFKKFRKGEDNISIGMTHLRFDHEGRVVYHQDYWDAAANLFEKVPVVGAGIRAVKRRL